MNRREWTKILARGAAGAAIVSGFEWSNALRRGRTAPYSCFVVTDRPHEAVRRLAQIAGEDVDDMNVTVRGVAPVRQDLTVVQQGRILDPAADSVPDGLRSFASVLRKASTPATHFVAIETASPSEPNDVVFESEGRVVEVLDAKSDYRRIVIAGAHGNTVFRFEGGELSVVSSSCRHELCKRCGPIKTGRIICAPNQLVATLGNPYASFDTVTG